MKQIYEDRLFHNFGDGNLKTALRSLGDVYPTSNSLRVFQQKRKLSIEETILESDSDSEEEQQHDQGDDNKIKQTKCDSCHLRQKLPPTSFLHRFSRVSQINSELSTIRE